jgi:RNA polymerase sigma-70 factor, ECF subfamily
MSGSPDIKVVWNNLSSGLRLFIISKVKNDSDADDILQDVYLKIHDNIHNLKDDTRIKQWIYQIARNLIIDYFRANNLHQKESGFLLREKASSSSSKFMDTAISDMIDMMDEMAQEYCEALCLTEIEGMSQKDYAEKKGLSYSGAKSRVQRARMILKDMLLNCCHYQFDKYGTVIDIQPKCCCCRAHEHKT